MNSFRNRCLCSKGKNLYRQNYARIKKENEEDIQTTLRTAVTAPTSLGPC